MATTSDSADFTVTFYGILNAVGDFWTPVPFATEDSAWAHVRRFWGNDKERLKQSIRTFKVVPVRVQLTALEPADSQ